MEAVMSWVKSGLLFGIFASVILMLSPNKVYQKHIGMVVGMIFILVMLHPLMVLLNVDSKTYVSYIQNFLKLENYEQKMDDSSLPIYENSIEKELLTVFLERGYPVEHIAVSSDKRGNVKEVAITFCGDVYRLDVIEQYIKRLFGKEVNIIYENG